MYKNDYILDQIEMLGVALRRLLLGVDQTSSDIFNDDGTFSNEKFLKYRLKKLILGKRINEAENLLFSEINENPKYYNLDVAIFFYKELAKLSNAELEKANFSNEEIVSGIEDIKRIFKIEK